MTVLLAIVSTSEAHVIDAHRRWRRCSRLDRFCSESPCSKKTEQLKQLILKLVRNSI